MELRELYRTWHHGVRAVARSFLVDLDEVDEVVQEVFIEVWRRLPQYDAARGARWSWIRAITRSRCLDHLRAAHVLDRTAARLQREPRARTGPDDAAGDGDRLRLLVEALPASQKTAIELAYFEGLTHREISQRTSEPIGTIKTRLRLGLARLAAALRSSAPLSVRISAARSSS